MVSKAFVIWPPPFWSLVFPPIHSLPSNPQVKLLLFYSHPADASAGNLLPWTNSWPSPSLATGLYSRETILNGAKYKSPFLHPNDIFYPFLTLFFSLASIPIWHTMYLVMCCLPLQEISSPEEKTRSVCFCTLSAQYRWWALNKYVVNEWMNIIEHLCHVCKEGLAWVLSLNCSHSGVDSQRWLHTRVTWEI